MTKILARHVGVPTAGMVLGNSLTGISICLDSLLESLTERGSSGKNTEGTEPSGASARSSVPRASAIRPSSAWS